MNTTNSLLPLGTVVFLEGGTIPVMIVLRHPILETKEGLYYLDYAGVNQLTGLNPEEITYFNHENISEVIFEGFVSDTEERVQKALKEWAKEHSEVKKGDVDTISSLL